MKIMIIRHAEDVGSPFADEERGLTELGRKQARQLGELLQEFKPTRLISSPLTRAKETAEIAAKHCQCDFSIFELVREQEEGPLSDGEASDTKKGFVKDQQTFKGGTETFADLADRAQEFADWLHIQSSKPDMLHAKIVVITHGRFMTFLIAKLLGFEPDGFFLAIAHAAYVIVSMDKQWRPMIVLPVARTTHG